MYRRIDITVLAQAMDLHAVLPEGRVTTLDRKLSQIRHGDTPAASHARDRTSAPPHLVPSRLGATHEARSFFIAAFCRVEESLSRSVQMGWLVGAVGIELLI